MNPNAEEQDPSKTAVRHDRGSASQAVMDDGTLLVVRAIRPDDAPLVIEFHGSVSERGVYMRYSRALGLGHRTARERLTRVCSVDDERGMVIVAESRNPGTGEPEIVGIGRLSRNPEAPDEAEAAPMVSDHFQRRGLGTTLLEELGSVTGKTSRLQPIRTRRDYMVDHRSCLLDHDPADHQPQDLPLGLERGLLQSHPHALDKLLQSTIACAGTRARIDCSPLRRSGAGRRPWSTSTSGCRPCRSTRWSLA